MKPGYLLATGERIANERLRAVVHASRLPPHMLETKDDDLAVRAAIGRCVGDPWHHDDVVVVLDEGASLRAVRAVPVLSTSRPYVGVTGFVRVEEVNAVAPFAVGCCRQIGYRFMGGVLVSAKTLRGESTESLRYPRRAEAECVLAALGVAGAWPVAHFNTRATGAEFIGEVAALLRALPSARGVQLNVPDLTRETVETLRRAHPAIEFIAQVRATQPGEILRTASDLCWVDFALCDASQGQGRALDMDTMGSALRLARRYGDAMPNLAVAGGLGPLSDDILYDLAVLAAPRDLSFDAEGQLRVPVAGADVSRKHQDCLDAVKAAIFVSAATCAIERARTQACGALDGFALCAALRSMAHGRAVVMGELFGEEGRAWAIFEVSGEHAPPQFPLRGGVAYRATVVADASAWRHVPEHLSSVLDGHAIAYIGWRQWALLSAFEPTLDKAVERVRALAELAARGPVERGRQIPPPPPPPRDAALADAWQRGAAAMREAILAALVVQAETSEQLGANASARTIRYDVRTARAVSLPPYTPKDPGA